MNQKQNLKQLMVDEERSGDLENLQTCQNMFIVEERARKAKELQEKLENKLNWEKQMEDRK
jgi:hypothetical protein